MQTNTSIRIHIPRRGCKYYRLPLHEVNLRALKSCNATILDICTDYSAIEFEYKVTQSIRWLNRLVQKIEDLPDNLASKALDLLAIGTDWEYICEELEI